MNIKLKMFDKLRNVFGQKTQSVPTNIKNIANDLKKLINDNNSICSDILGIILLCCFMFNIITTHMLSNIFFIALSMHSTRLLIRYDETDGSDETGKHENFRSELYNLAKYWVVYSFVTIITTLCDTIFGHIMIISSIYYIVKIYIHTVLIVSIYMYMKKSTINGQILGIFDTEYINKKIRESKLIISHGNNIGFIDTIVYTICTIYYNNNVIFDKILNFSLNWYVILIDNILNNNILSHYNDMYIQKIDNVIQFFINKDK